jgi:3-polyprenyl-4-hydroxybenzoate decarboxylase
MLSIAGDGFQQKRTHAHFIQSCADTTTQQRFAAHYYGHNRHDVSTPTKSGSYLHSRGKAIVLPSSKKAV